MGLTYPPTFPRGSILPTTNLAASPGRRARDKLSQIAPAMPVRFTSETIALRARLAGFALDLAAIRLQLLLKAGFNPGQPRVPTGQSGGGRWADSGGGATGGGDQPPQVSTGKPIRLAQVGGASTMTNVGPDSGPHLGATLVAPSGKSVGSFIVSPLTNNVYSTPLGPVDVTGWTAYYGPPGSRLDRGPTERPESYPNGALWFINPSETQSLLRPVSPGM